MKTNHRSLCGTFNPTLNIKELLEPTPEESLFKPNIAYLNYEVASTGKVDLLFAGDIYNSEELSKEYGLETKTDSDLLLELYLLGELEIFKKINGKFTVVIREKTRCIIVRDRCGEGPPIYYTSTFFTDSFEGAYRFNGFSPQPDPSALSTFLQISYIPSPNTSIANLKKLAPGNVLICNGNFTIYSLFDFEEFHSEKIRIDEQEALNEYERLLKQSINRRIKNSKHVGLLLSGGFDSGGNIALTNEIFDGKVSAFSIGFKDEEHSELPFSRMMAEKFGSEYQEYRMDGSEIEDLPKIIKHMGDPFSESGFMLNHSVMKVAGGHDLPVVLGGDGSDQLFNTALKELNLHYKLKNKKLQPLQKAFRHFSENRLFEQDDILFRTRFHNTKILNILQPDLFGFRDYQLKKMMNESFHPSKVIEENADVISYADLYDHKNYFLDINQTTNEVILFKASRLSDMHRVNLTFPYIDLDVYNFVRKLPLELKTGGSGTSKYLLKKLLKSKLPEEVTNRKKQGGFSPLAIFLDDPIMRTKIFRYILNGQASKQLFKQGYLKRFLEKYDSSVNGTGYWFWYKQVRSMQVFHLLILTLWWDIFIERKYDESFSNYLN